MGAIFNVFPLILIPVLTYNIWAFGATAANNGDGAAVREHLADAWMHDADGVRRARGSSRSAT